MRALFVVLLLVGCASTPPPSAERFAFCYNMVMREVHGLWEGPSLVPPAELPACIQELKNIQDRGLVTFGLPRER